MNSVRIINNYKEKNKEKLKKNITQKMQKIINNTVKKI